MRERAVRMVFDHQDEHSSHRAAWSLEGIDDVEYGTLTYVDWFNHRRNPSTRRSCTSALRAISTSTRSARWPN